jgi:dCTP deaminase
MILSNIEIQNAIDQGLLVIKPDPQPRSPSAANPRACPYDTTSVDLQLGDTISIPRSGPYSFDLRQSGLASFLSQNCDHVKLNPTGGYALQSNQFVLGSTLEAITLPINPGRRILAARIEGKSSFARCGLLVHFTAPTVHAGWDGPLTLEIKNLGVTAITLYPGMAICQLILEEVSGTPSPNPSQFQGQTIPTGLRKTP